MLEQHHLSERHACRLVGLSRDSYRHPPQPSELNATLGEQIRQTALVRRRFGYRRIHDMLRQQFPGVNHKRIYRLYRQANLTVKKRRKVKRPTQERVPLQLARNINEVLSMDFVSDSLSSGRRIKCLTVVDDFSKESVDITVDYGIGPVRHPRPRPSGQVPRLPGSSANGQRPGVHQSGVPGLGAQERDSAHPD